MALKASPDDQAALLDLQAIDTKLQQLTHRAKNLPQLAALRELDGRAEKLRARRVEQAGLLDDARTELARIESDVALVEARIARDAARLQASSSVKDVAGLESELTGLRRRLGELEEIELAVMERVEQHETDGAGIAAEQAELDAQRATVSAERDAAAAGIESERAHSAANRSTIAGRLPEELVALYERQRSRYGSGASLLRGGVSGASGVKLLENELAVIRSASADDVLICPDSQAILVRTNESGL